MSDGERRRRRARPSAARTRGRARPSTRRVPRSSSGPRPSSPPRPWRRSSPGRRRRLSGRRASGICSASRGSGSMRTRSLQSPPVLVKPHATWPLLPTTMLGRPGSVTPVICRCADGCVGIGKRQRRAIPDDRHADRRGACRWRRAPTPDAVCAPSTAQLLLPMIAASSRRGHGTRKHGRLLSCRSHCQRVVSVFPCFRGL